jgi:hypothetical protein
VSEVKHQSPLKARIEQSRYSDHYYYHYCIDCGERLIVTNSGRYRHVKKSESKVG